jgi:hypothetical protein
MRDRVLGAVVWTCFVVIVGCCCYVFLAACDLGRPIFGLRYCAARTAPDGLADQRAREHDLQDRIHEAELHIARLPACAPPPPPPVEARKEAVHQPAPQPKPPEPVQPPHDELTIPRDIADLQGCWQSVSGDLPMVSDDREQRPLGNVRICYCFAENGRGVTRYIYTNGGKCIGPLRARLSSDELTMSHGRIGCVGVPNQTFVVPTTINCKAHEGDSATCDAHYNGKSPTTVTDQKYRRVTAEYCE